MIKANDLRVGNYIKFNNNLDKEKIVQINLRFFASWAGGRNPDEMKVDEEISNYYTGIGLTDEILLKAGFKELNYGWYAKEYFTDCNEAAEVMSIQYNLTTGRCGIGDTDFGGCNAMTGKVFHSLHQLQNLVYSLTGSELEVVW